MKKYKGWHLFAPVWVQDPDGEFIVTPRWGIIGAGLDILAEAVEASINFFLSMTNPHYEPCFLFFVDFDNGVDA